MNLVASHAGAVDTNGRYDRGDGTDTLIASALTASAGHHGHSSPRGDGSDNLIARGVALRGREGGATAELGDEAAFALRASQGGGDKSHAVVAAPMSRHPYDADGNVLQCLPSPRVRRLTPVECERLQGFPDGWTEPAGSDSARYRCLGNAVTVNVAEWLGGRILAYERGELEEAGAA